MRWEPQAVAHAGPTAWASTGSIQRTATSTSAARAICRRTPARAPAGASSCRAWAHLSLQRQDGVPRRLCDRRRQPSFINFRNSYPSVFTWAMPAGRFGGVDNPFIPVTTLPAGPRRAGRRARHSLGPHPAAPERRHEHLCEGRRARQGPLVQRHRAARVHAVAHRPGRLRRHARESDR